MVGDIGAQPDPGGDEQRKQPGSFRQWPAIATDAAAPIRLPKMRPMLLLITPPTVGKLTTAAEVSAQEGSSSSSTNATHSARHIASELRSA